LISLSPKWFLAIYALLLCCLAPLRPLWLDECLQFSDTYRHSLPDTTNRVAHNPGGVPLAYLAENVFVNAFNHPRLASHLFSILCAVAGMASLIWLTRLLGLSDARPAALAYALLPISVRYAVEARQYGPALAFSLCATAVLVWLDRQPSWPRAFLYGSMLALGLYSQPYIAFIVVAHACWAFERRYTSKYVLFAATGAFLAFLPWFLYARGFWAQAVTAGGYRSSIALTTPLMILRELSGSGYVLSIALVALAVFGYSRSQMGASSKHLLLLCILVPLPLVGLANTLFHYFFAIRQLLFIVPSLCILAAEGIRALPAKPLLIAAALVILAIGYDVHWFTSVPSPPCSALIDLRLLRLFP